MKFPTNMRVLALLGCGALVPSFAAPAQVSLQFHFGEEDDYHRIDSRHPLKGRQYQTMAALAHTLDEIAQDLNQEVYRTARASRGDRSKVKLLASISDFARRSSDFHNRMDSYLDSPWDIRKEVDDVTRRARDINQRIVDARVFPGTIDRWNSAIDVLGRMQRVLTGADVQLPASPVRHDADRHGDWDHRDVDRNGNGIPDRLEGQPVPQPMPVERAYDHDDRDRGGAQAANLPELRRLGRELDERVGRTRDSMPRGDARAPETFDRFTADSRRVRQTLDTDRFDVREVKDTVSRLLDDARRSANEYRRGRGYPGDENDWQRIVEILTRMQSLLQ